MDVAAAFLSLAPASSKRARSWINFDCPLCGDRRKRGGLLETDTGGFRYRCFNGGCQANGSAIGWEPGSGLGGRPRMLFKALGGDVRNLPIQDLMRSPDRYDGRGNLISRVDSSAVTLFPQAELPEGSELLSEVDTEGLGDAEMEGLSCVLGYLERFGQDVPEYPFAWSREMPSHLIVPYYHRGGIVGWLGRSCGSARQRFIGTSPKDYVFAQDTLERSSSRSAIVVEGVMDAIAISGVALRNSSPTEKQVLLLELCGQDIIVLPDQDRAGLGLVDVAEKKGWRVSIPDWDRGVKDPCDAVARYGILYAVESIVRGASKNYIKARARIITS